MRASISHSVQDGGFIWATYTQPQDFCLSQDLYVKLIKLLQKCFFIILDTAWLPNTRSRSTIFMSYVKPIFHLATLFARREAKTRIRQRDWFSKIGWRKNSPRTSRKRSYFFVCSREQSRQVENRLKCSFFQIVVLHKMVNPGKMARDDGYLLDQLYRQVINNLLTGN